MKPHYVLLPVGFTVLLIGLLFAFVIDAPWFVILPIAGILILVAAALLAVVEALPDNPEPTWKEK